MKLREIQKRYSLSMGYSTVMICNKHRQVLQSAFNDVRILEGALDIDVLDWNEHPNRGTYCVVLDCEYVDLMGSIEKKRRNENE